MKAFPVPTGRITVEIDTLESSKVVQFLVENAIPFSLSYKTLAVEPKQKDNENTSISPPSVIKMKTQTTISPKTAIEKLYEKYLHPKREGVVPSVEVLAVEFGASATKLKRLFLNRYNETLYAACQKKRMEYAALLLERGYKCNEVTTMVGYGESSAIKFNKMFQKHFGVTPKKYQLAHYGRIDRR